MRGRPNTITTETSKTATSTIKRGAAQPRPNSGDSETSSTASIVIESMHSHTLKIITEVDGKMRKIVFLNIILYIL
jgi:hypothetical protein